ncbi:hypothetical protein MKW92_050908 [Papaver armeniacum]|nr:hypothetical protein MKW92_050908 [Papaver armeniacum]
MSIGPSGTIPGTCITTMEANSLLLLLRLAKLAEMRYLLDKVFSEEKKMTGKDAVKLCLGDAVSNKVAFFPCLFTQTAISLALGTMNNETLGYFIGRVYLFLTHALGSVKNANGLASCK